jgi:hypothetical protein
MLGDLARPADRLVALRRWPAREGVPDLGMKDGVSGEWWTEWRAEWRLLGRLGEFRWLLFGGGRWMLANGFGPRPLGCGIREPLIAKVGVAGVDFEGGDRGLAKLAPSPAPSVGDATEPPPA